MADDLILKDIENKIHTIRGKQVMLDEDLAELYGVETKQINRAVKRNIDRFPSDFYFQLSDSELMYLRYQIGTAKKDWGKKRFNPYVFTEHGVTALSGVLRSRVASNISVKVVRSFISMRRFISQNANFFQKFHQIDQKIIDHDDKLSIIFDKLESKRLTSDEGIYFDGQVYDSHKFISDLLKTAKKEIILIDNYVTEDTLTLFSDLNLKITIYTKEISNKLQLALGKYNQQYKPIEIKQLTRSHDRYLIIDKKETYHIGASLKDLGKKWFSFSKIDVTDMILERMNGD